MKTTLKSKTKKKATVRNPVAKHAGKFNRAAKHKDRKKALKRGDIKHRAHATDPL